MHLGNINIFLKNLTEFCSMHIMYVSRSYIQNSSNVMDIIWKHLFMEIK